MNQVVRLLGRPSSAPILHQPVAEVVGFDWLEARAEAWDRLVNNAAYPNPFFSRRVVGAHVASGLSGRSLRFIAVHRGGALLALLPFAPRGARLGLLRAAHAGWTSPYVVNGTPLIARDELDEAAEGILDALPLVGGSRFWKLPLLSLDDPVTQALGASMQRRGWATEVVSAFERAVLDRRTDYETYAGAHLGAGRRKALRRHHSRLAALGRIEFQSFTDGRSLGRAVDDFLSLEARGWKGRRGTALASRPETAALARQLFGPGEGPVLARADCLTLDGQPIAVSLALLCGGTAHLLKTAYDESLRKHAPGVALENEIVRACHETSFARRLDSASLPGGVLDDLYPDRERIGDIVLASDPKVTSRKLRSITDRDQRCRDGLKRLKASYWRLSDTARLRSARRTG